MFSLLPLYLPDFSHSADLGVIVIGDFSSFGSKGHVVQFRLGANDHSTLTGELEVGAGGSQVDFPNELTGRVPDMYSVSTSGVYVALGIAVNPIWESDVDKGECLAASPCTVLIDGEAVAVDQQSGP
jgi:hypothetical protein